MAIPQISSTMMFYSYSTCLATAAWPVFRCNIIIHTFAMILTKFISSLDDQFHDRTTHPDSLALHDSVAIFNLCNWNLIAILTCVEIKSPGFAETLTLRTSLWSSGSGCWDFRISLCGLSRWLVLCMVHFLRSLSCYLWLLHTQVVTWAHNHCGTSPQLVRVSQSCEALRIKSKVTNV